MSNQWPERQLLQQFVDAVRVGGAEQDPEHPDCWRPYIGESLVVAAESVLQQDALFAPGDLERVIEAALAWADEYGGRFPNDQAAIFAACKRLSPSIVKKLEPHFLPPQ